MNIEKIKKLLEESNLWDHILKIRNNSDENSEQLLLSFNQTIQVSDYLELEDLDLTIDDEFEGNFLLVSKSSE